MPNRLYFRPCLFYSLLCTLFLSCNAEEPLPTPTPPPVETIQPTATPLTIEVTRVVETQLVVTATPLPPVACDTTTLEQSQAIVIGALAPVTGRSAKGGLAMITGINIAVDQLNAAGGIAGKPLQLILYDTASDPQRGREQALQLITNDCAVAIVGVYDGLVAAEVNEVVHTLGVPIILLETYPDELTATRYPEVFRISPTATMLAKLASEWLGSVGDFNRDGELFTVVIGENSSYGITQTQQTIDWLTVAGVQAESVLVDLPTSDFSPVIAQIVDLAMRPDAVLIRVRGDAGIELQRQLQDSGIRPQNGTLLAATQSALDDRKFWSTLGEEGNFTVVFRYGPWHTSLLDQGQQFAQSYKAFTERFPENSAFGGYDAVLLLADAVQRSNSLAGNDLIAALETTDLTLASGHYTFPINSQSPGDAGTPDYLWHQWQDAPLLYLQYSEPGQASSAMPVIWPPLYKTVDDVVLRP